MKIEITLGGPNDFSPDERSRFCELVELGGEVDTVVLRQNVENAKALVFARSGGRLLGIAALKFPNLIYRKNVAAKSGFDLDSDLFPFEIGYVFVQQDARGNGISHRLVAATLEKSEGQHAFATARTDNVGMLRTLDSAAFSQVGNDYPGQNAGSLIRLLVRIT
jgi:predicted GNAT family N-acyltransferase